jgi:peptidoglycan hydrolase FlgJ
MLDLTQIMPAVGQAAEPVTPSPRLEKASHQFEASMLQELLKPMQEHSGFSDKDENDDSGADSNSSLLEYGTEVMANALSERGGLGISKMVLAKLAPVEAAQERHKSANLRKT